MCTKQTNKQTKGAGSKPSQDIAHCPKERFPLEASWATEIDSQPTVNSYERDYLFGEATLSMPRTNL